MNRTIQTRKLKRTALPTAGAMVAATRLAGCAATLFDTARYKETVDRFLVSEGGRKFAVIAVPRAGVAR